MKFKKIILVFIAVFAAIAFYIFSVSENGLITVSYSIDFCIKKLVPALFPSVVVSGYIMNSGLWHYLSKPFSKLFSCIYGVPNDCGFACFLGLLFGFPISAICSASLYEKRKLTAKQAELICVSCSIPSIPFVVGFVGKGLYDSYEIGVSLYIILVFSSVCCGLLFSEIKTGNDNNEGKVKLDIISPIVPSVSDAIQKVLIMCGYVMFFSVAGNVFVQTFCKTSLGSAIIFGIFEMTQGVVYASKLPFEISVILTSAVLGFSGISVACQLMSCLMPLNIKNKRYLPVKLFMSALCCFFSYAVFRLPYYFSSVLCFIVLLFVSFRFFKSKNQLIYTTENH